MAPCLVFQMYAGTSIGHLAKLPSLRFPKTDSIARITGPNHPGTPKSHLPHSKLLAKLLCCLITLHTLRPLGYLVSLFASYPKLQKK